MNHSLVEVAISIVIWLNVLILYMVWQRQTIRQIMTYSLVFLWFSAVAISLSLFAGLIPVATDGVSYFQWASTIAESGFQPETVNTYADWEWTKAGPSVFTLLEAGVIYLTYPSFPILFVAQILIATLAVFYMSRLAGLLFGPASHKYVLFGFLVYFAWYWHALQNLREPMLLLFMGIAFLHYMLWWASGRRSDGVLAVAAALISVAFRPENILIVIAVIGLTFLYRHRAFLKRVAKGIVVVPPLLYVAYQLSLDLRNRNLFGSINLARENRTEAGHHLANLHVSSIWDMLSQLPDTFRFFLVPIWPWQLDTGLVFIRAYVHSLSAFVLLTMAVIGMVKLRLVLRDQRLATPTWILAVSIFAVAALYSVIDIGAGIAARHSVFAFYFLLGSFAPVGFWYLRQKSAQLVAGRSRRRPRNEAARTTAAS